MFFNPLTPQERSHYCAPGLTIGSTAVHGGPPLLSSLHYLPGLTIGSTAACPQLLLNSLLRFALFFDADLWLALGLHSGIRVMASRTCSGRIFSRTDFVPYQHQLVQLPVFELSEAHTANEDFAMLLFDAAQRCELEDEACSDDAEGAELTNGPLVEGSAHTPRPSTSSAPSRLHVPLSREEQRKDAKRARRSSARVAAAKLRTPHTRITAASRPAAAASAPPMPDDAPICLFDINAQSFRVERGRVHARRPTVRKFRWRLMWKSCCLMASGMSLGRGEFQSAYMIRRIVGSLPSLVVPPIPGDKVIRNVVASMECARDEGLQKQSISADSVHHRRGDFVALATGTSHGGGQKQPGNLKHTPLQGHLIQHLLGDRNIQRIAGFQSSAFAVFSPKLYGHYATVLRDLYDNDPSLQIIQSSLPALLIVGPTQAHDDTPTSEIGHRVNASSLQWDAMIPRKAVISSCVLAEADC
ncbi:hypothetical protein FPV67DRAFT_1783365 [Lyophyllum atratum]|nr:hypothetical protein FPV67DRAFT_1783365 [Lyophyllum atratum]